MSTISDSSTASTASTASTSDEAAIAAHAQLHEHEHAHTHAAHHAKLAPMVEASIERHGDKSYFYWQGKGAWQRREFSSQKP